MNASGPSAACAATTPLRLLPLLGGGLSASMFSSVLLPDPDGPMMARTRAGQAQPCFRRRDGWISILTMHAPKCGRAHRNTGQDALLGHMLAATCAHAVAQVLEPQHWRLLRLHLWRRGVSTSFGGDVTRCGSNAGRQGWLQVGCYTLLRLHRGGSSPKFPQHQNPKHVATMATVLPPLRAPQKAWQPCRPARWR